MRYKIYFLALAILFSLFTISATIELGNLSHSIENSYTKMTPLKGWVNFSVEEEPGNTLITAFDSKTTLSELVNINKIFCDRDNSYECTCFPSDCEPAFSTINTAAETKTYALDDLETKLFGFKVEENMNQVTTFKVTNFRFNVSTDAASSCINPLMIDLFDDGNIEFKTDTVSDEECLISKPFGCFELAETEGVLPIVATELCQKIIVPPARGLKVGANVIGDESASFTMKFSAPSLEEESCDITNVQTGGQISCKIILATDLTTETEVEICIFATEGNEGKYNINFERNNSCGFVNDEAKTPHDFEIFAKPLKYAPLPKFAFNDKMFIDERNMSTDISDYIRNRYQNKCDGGCIVPLRIYSGIDQSLMLSKGILDYNIGGANTPNSNQTNFEDLVSTPALFTSAFIKYDLEPANFITPSNTNITELELEIGDKSITQNISIIKIPSITTIIPTKTATLVPTRFFAIISESGNLTYSWNFGDNSLPQTTQKNIIEYTYAALGTYHLTVNITNELGTTSKTVSVKVVAPFQAINDTIVDYRARLKSIDNNLFVLSDKVQERISGVLDTADLKAAINRIEEKYKLLFESESEELVKLMQQLNELNVPVSFGTSLEIKNSKFLQNANRLNLDIIGEYGAGNIEQDKTERYPSAINQWMEENIEVTMGSKTYSFRFADNSEQTALTHITMKLKPKRSIGEFYMIIEGDTNNIRFIGDNSEREIDSTHFGITFRDLEPEEERTIEFLYPEKTDALNAPVSVSPEFRFLELGFTPGVCNNDGMCTGNEDYKNCRADCKPITRTIIFLIILLVIAFTVYIALQEWYKRNYQNHLFKSPNELFNLITFMNNGKHQGLSKSQIFKQLKQRKWNSEQLGYAWKKLNNKRTGMFEIPILRPFEKRKLKKEIAKRKAMGLS